MAKDKVFKLKPSLGLSLGSSQLPAQNVSYSTKQKPEWQRACMDFFDQEAQNQQMEKREIAADYRYANGDIDQSDYKEFTDVMGLGAKKDLEYGKTEPIEHFPICNRPIMTILGEFIKRPLNFYVRNESATARNEYYRVKSDLLFQSVLGQVQQRIAGQLQQQGMDPNTEEFGQQVQQMTPQQVQEYVDKDWQDTSEQVGQRIINSLRKSQQLDDIFLEGFQNAVKASQTLYHVYTVNGKTRIRDVSPLDAFWHKSPSNRWIGEGSYVGYRLYLSLSSIIDTFHGKLKEQDINELLEIVSPGSTNSAGGEVYDTRKINFDGGKFNNLGQPADINRETALHNITMDYWQNGGNNSPSNMNGLFPVTIAYWRSYCPLYFLHRPDTDQLDLVDEYYKPDKDLGEWVEILPWEQIYQGVKIHEKIYLDVKPYTDYILDIENLDGIVLPIDGCVFNSNNAKPLSMVKLMRPWNKMYDIVAHSLKKDMNSALGKVILMSYDHLPNIPGFSKEKWMYWLRELRVMWVQQPQKNTGFNQFSSVDMSFADQMVAKMNILERIRMECDTIAGFSPSRIAGSGGDAQTLGESRQQFQSSVNQTEYIFFKHNQLVGRILNYALNLTKKNIKKYGHLRNLFDDMEQAYLDYDVDTFLESKLGTYVTNSLEDLSSREKLDQYISFAVSNGADIVDMADMLLARTNSEIKNVMEKLRRERKQAAAQEGAQKDAELKLKERELDDAMVMSRERNASNEEIAYMKTFGLQKDNMKDTDDSGTADVLEFDKFVEERLAQQRQFMLASRKQQTDEIFKSQELKLKKEEIDVKRQDSKNKVTIAKANKNRFSTN